MLTAIPVQQVISFQYYIQHHRIPFFWTNSIFILLFLYSPFHRKGYYYYFHSSSVKFNYLFLVKLHKAVQRLNWQIYANSPPLEIYKQFNAWISKCSPPPPVQRHHLSWMYSTPQNFFLLVKFYFHSSSFYIQRLVLVCMFLLPILVLPPPCSTFISLQYWTRTQNSFYLDKFYFHSSNPTTKLMDGFACYER